MTTVSIYQVQQLSRPESGQVVSSLLKATDRVKEGRFYHWKRHLLVNVDDKIYHLSLNIFERIAKTLLSLFRVDFLKIALPSGRRTPRVIDVEKLIKLLQALRDPSSLPKVTEIKKVIEIDPHLLPDGFTRETIANCIERINNRSKPGPCTWTVSRGGDPSLSLAAVEYLKTHDYIHSFKTSENLITVYVTESDVSFVPSLTLSALFRSALPD